MNDSFLGLIFSSFMKTNGPVIAVCGLLLGVIAAKFLNNTISLLWVILLFFLVLILIITFLAAAYKAFYISKHILPKVIYSKKVNPTDGSFKVLCLLEPSELFSNNTLVSFYYVREGNFEEFVGFGNVINVQEDKRIQVSMDQYLDVQEDIVNKLAENNALTLENIKVKPNIPKAQIELIWDL